MEFRCGGANAINFVQAGVASAKSFQWASQWAMVNRKPPRVWVKPFNLWRITSAVGWRGGEIR